MAIDLRNKYKVTWQLNDGEGTKEVTKIFAADGFELAPGNVIVFFNRPKVASLGADKPMGIPCAIVQGFLSIELVDE